MATTIITTFEDVEAGTKAYVSRIETGFSVSLQDLDSGLFLSAVTIYPDEAQAIRAAKKLANVKEGGAAAPSRPIIRNVRQNSWGETVGECNGRPVKWTYSTCLWYWADRREGELNGYEGLEGAVREEAAPAAPAVPATLKTNSSLFPADYEGCVWVELIHPTDLRQHVHGEFLSYEAGVRYAQDMLGPEALGAEWTRAEVRNSRGFLLATLARESAPRA